MFISRITNDTRSFKTKKEQKKVNRTNGDENFSDVLETVALGDSIEVTNQKQNRDNASRDKNESQQNQDKPTTGGLDITA